MNKRILVIAFFTIITVILSLGIIDVLNADNELYGWIRILLGQENFFYFDLPFIQTTLSLFEISGLFLAVFSSFFILHKEQIAAKKRVQLAHKPFIKTSARIVFKPYDNNLGIAIENIGLGPALFIRVAFVEFNPDNSENATLKSDQPHSQYLGPDEKSSELIFDPRLFYKFITGTDRGGDLGSDPNNYNNPPLKKELNDLIKVKVGQHYLIYIHSSDILGNQMIFKVKYLLCINYDYGDMNEFLLKRMEIQLTGSDF